jgi:hypothetical protein
VFSSASSILCVEILGKFNYTAKKAITAPFFQVTAQDKVFKKQDSRFFRISASRFLA